MGKRNTGLIFLLLTSASVSGQSVQALDEATHDHVVSEVTGRLDQYASDVTSKDLDAILSFWSDSAEFVFAGDGKVLGGFQEWAAVAKADNDQTDRWNYWNWSEVHILPLSRNAASATLEFDYKKVLLSGETVRGHGSWTYVMKRTGSDWQVFHGNGHHIAR